MNSLKLQNVVSYVTRVSSILCTLCPMNFGLSIFFLFFFPYLSSMQQNPMHVYSKLSLIKLKEAYSQESIVGS